MRSLLLVRHPRPLAEPGIPSHRCGLGMEGLHASLALGDQLPPYTTAILSSPAPVAAQTARAMAVTRNYEIGVLLDDRLADVAGPQSPELEDAAAVDYYLDGGEIASWEDPDRAVARFSSALLAAQERHLRATAVVTHGLVLALWLAPRLGTTPKRVWDQLKAPDVWWYDPASNSVARRKVIAPAPDDVASAQRQPNRSATIG